MRQRRRTMRTHSFKLLLISLPLFVLSGCETNQPRVEIRQPALPSNYRNSEPTAVASLSLASSPASWWQQYGSTELDRLVKQAVANNSDLRIARLQITQAKIRSDQSRAGKLPTITAPLRAAFQTTGGSTDAQQSSQAGLLATWRVDVWGEQSALIESADLQFWRAVHASENVQRNLIASLVSSYIAYLSAGDGLELARQNDAISQELLKTTEQRFALGDATANELEQLRANLYAQQAIIPSLENQQEDIRITIARLLGTVPGSVELSAKGVDELLLPTVSSGLPSSLLLRRPDIRMMEARMRAANADIEVARARLLPPIDLSVQGGYSGLSIAQLLQPQNFLLSTIASLAVTIFDGGRREGEKAYANAYYEEMVETYAQTVLQAIREVESALSTLRSTNLRLDAQKRSTRATLNLFKIASESFLLGAVDLTTVLDTRKNYQRSVDETQKLKADLLRSYVNLSQALGSTASN